MPVQFVYYTQIKVNYCLTSKVEIINMFEI